MYLKKALDNAQQSTEDDGVEGYLLGETVTTERASFYHLTTSGGIPVPFSGLEKHQDPDTGEKRDRGGVAGLRTEPTNTQCTGGTSHLQIPPRAG